MAGAPGRPGVDRPVVPTAKYRRDEWSPTRRPRRRTKAPTSWGRPLARHPALGQEHARNRRSLMGAAARTARGSRARSSRAAAAARAPRRGACRAAAGSRAPAARQLARDVREHGILVVAGASSPAGRCSSRRPAARAPPAPPPGCDSCAVGGPEEKGRTPVVLRDQLGVGVDLRGRSLGFWQRSWWLIVWLATRCPWAAILCTRSRRATSSGDRPQRANR